MTPVQKRKLAPGRGQAGNYSEIPNSPTTETETMNRNERIDQAAGHIKRICPHDIGGQMIHAAFAQDSIDQEHPPQRRTLDGVLVSPTDVIWCPTDPKKPRKGGMDVLADGVAADVCDCYSSIEAAPEETA